MICAMKATVAVELSGEHSFEAFLDELEGALQRRGLTVEPEPEGRVLQGDTEVGTIAAWEPGRVTIEWQPANWAPDDRTEIEVRAEKDRIRVEHKGFGEQFWDPAEIAGWFADEVAAPLLAASAPERYGDWLTDRAARR